VTSLTLLVENLSTGIVYRFKVRARNAEGFGEFSSPVEILTAQEPDAPVEPTSEFVRADDSVVIRWSAPYNRGSEITAYKVYIQRSDGLLSLELSSCDGSNSVIKTAALCSIPINTLKQAPFQLAWGSSVYAYVVATNIYGDSDYSPRGNGAVIITKPDAPESLSEDTLFRRPSELGL